MYLAIDVGGTKTLMAVFSETGELIKTHKMPTNHSYPTFLHDLENAIKSEFKDYQFSHCCCAVPGTIDFEKGVAVAFGNEDWSNIPFRQDIQHILPASKVLIHNDAKLAALSEASLLNNQYPKVLYLTISTGIGGGVIVDGKIDPGFENFEPGQMVFEYNGQTSQWEDFASGRALKVHYGKLASEITDPEIWREYANTLIIGFENLTATIKPDVIVVGGGVGAHFEMFNNYLKEGLDKINNPLVPIPPLLKAQRPEEAVIYGCYELIEQHNQ